MPKSKQASAKKTRRRRAAGTSENSFVKKLVHQTKTSHVSHRVHELKNQIGQATTSQLVSVICLVFGCLFLAVCVSLLIFHDETRSAVASKVNQHQSELESAINTLRNYMEANLTLPMQQKFNASWDSFRSSILGTSHLSAKRPGIASSLEGITKRHHVVFVPGVITTGLELWMGHECSQSYFRKRLWGSTTMVTAMLRDMNCWIKHVSLNRTNYLDPNGIKLRPAQGMEAADYLFSIVWVYAILIENLADIGYDPNDMYMAGYDWRLSPYHLEVRDHYFTHLKTNIEHALSVNGRKSVAICHSHGSNVFYYFLKWVESDSGGKGGPDWVSRHIDSFVNIGGPLLGTMKAMAGLLSGEMKDSADMGIFQDMVLDKMMSPSLRVSILRSWASGPTLLPKGGTRVWGNLSSAPDDLGKDCLSSHGPSIALRNSSSDVVKKLDVEASMDLLRNTSSSDFQHLLEQYYSFDWNDNPDNGDDRHHSKWTNPLESTLPLAPNMTIYCIYGHNKATERAYYYVDSDEDFARPNLPTEANHQVEGPKVPYRLDRTQDNSTCSLKSGVVSAEGDGTVPLVSLGYMCVDAWQRREYNPGNVKIVTREYEHNPVPLVLDPRGGGRSADHVDIMGNDELVQDVLNIVAGRSVAERILSKIQDIASRISSRT